MSQSSTPVVLKDNNGNLKRASSSDVNYLAYQAGLHLATDTDSATSITLNVEGGDLDTLVGSFVDTFYEQPVGTHPASSLTVGTTTTKLYQRQETVETDELSAFRRPVVDSDSGTVIRDMNSTTMATLGNSLLSIIETQEYPGAYRLSASAPSADWTASISDVFSDTTSDGTVTSYTIWQRTSATMPDSCSPMYVRRDAYGVLPMADYNDGLQAMTQDQVSTTFGQIVRNQFSTGEVGSYQLRSSAQGAPTDTGTWVSRGSAVDTRYTTQSQQYAGQYTGFSEVQYSGDRTYSGDYTSDPTDFAGTRQFAGDRTYSDQYGSPPEQFAGVRGFSGFRDKPGNFTSDLTDFAGVRVFAGSRNFADQYAGNPQPFGGVRSFSGPRTFSDQYASTPQPFAGVRYFSGPRTFSSAPNQYAFFQPFQFAGVRYFSGPRTFSDQYAGNPQPFGGVRYFSGPRQVYRPGVVYQYFAGARTVYYSRGVAYYRPVSVNQNFAGSRQYAGYQILFRPGVVTQPFAGSPQPFSREIFFSGSRGGPGVFTRNFPVNWSGSRNFSSVFYVPVTVSPIVNFDGTPIVVNYSGSRNFAGNITAYYSGVRTSFGSFGRDVFYNGPRQYNGPRVVYYTQNVPANYTRPGMNFNGNRVIQYLGYTVTYRPGIVYQPFGGNRAVQYLGPRTFNFSAGGNFTGPRQYAGSRTRSLPFGVNQYFAGPREVYFAGSRSRIQPFGVNSNFNGPRNFSGSRTRSQPFSVSGNFTGPRQYAGSRTKPNNFNRPDFFQGTRTFSGVRTFSTDYTTDNQFVGNLQYAGDRTYSDQYTGPDVFTGLRYFSGDRTYSGNYAGSYTNQYTGQYSGDTLIDTSETIETFTLYVRVS